MKRMVCAVLMCVFICPALMADDRADAEKLLKSKLEAVIAVLETKNIQKTDKKKKIIGIVEPIFDFTLMGKLALGKKLLPRLNAAERTRYYRLFTHRLKESYLEQILLYTDEKIVYEKSIQVKKKVHVPTILVTKSDRITMLYKLYKSKGNWLIYDIEIQGVSIISSYRSQFAQILRNGTPRDLLQELEKTDENK